MNEVLFHIAAAEDWRASGEIYVSPHFETEGFIHCSTPAQLEGVAQRRFRGRDDLLVLSIDPTRVRAPIRYENLEGGREQFPHIYGPLNVDAVVEKRALRVSADGKLSFAPGPSDV